MNWIFNCDLTHIDKWRSVNQVDWLINVLNFNDKYLIYEVLDQGFAVFAQFYCHSSPAITEIVFASLFDLF